MDGPEGVLHLSKREWSKVSSEQVPEVVLVDVLNGPRQANLVLIAYPRCLARTFAARSYKQ